MSHRSQMLTNRAQYRKSNKQNKEYFSGALDNTYAMNSSPKGAVGWPIWAIDTLGKPPVFKPCCDEVILQYQQYH